MNITEAQKRFKRVVIWGHPLHSHTSSFVHYGFDKAFAYLGFDTVWVPVVWNGPKNPVDIDLTDCLVLTEGQVCQNLPVIPSATYILHNVDEPRFNDAKGLRLQVYVNDIKERLVPAHARDSVTMVKPFHYTADIDGWRWLYQPWATDLLPHEINLDWAKHPRGKTCDWIGTIGSSSTEFGNSNEIDGFRRACSEHGYRFVHHQGQVSNEDNARIIRESFLAPTIVGKWQHTHGYIPCRIFKNTSYGASILTNSRESAECVDQPFSHDDDTYRLFLRGREAAGNYGQIERGMKCVRDKHTYLNRIETILEQLS